MSSLSPLAPVCFPRMYDVAGVEFFTKDVGVKYKERDDLFVAKFDEEVSIAGVFTQSLTSSAAVNDCRHSLKTSKGKARAIIVNSGNANAFTGRKGEDAVNYIIQESCKMMGCKPQEVYTASTGVIGEALPAEQITKTFDELKKANFEQAASAIMTTDTFVKGASQKCYVNDKKVVISGIAKGSGMIAPDMATMLSFIFTDLAVCSDVLQSVLNEINDKTFNSITVDSDTSTSDTVLIVATGKSGNKEIRDVNAPRLRAFKEALKNVMLDLAHQVVRDGEGASKFVSIEVNGGETNKSAHKIGLAIANSPLVKTAIAGEDANWGRIVAAIGKAGEKADRDRLSISIGGVEIAKDGEVVENYQERSVSQHMMGQEIKISVDVGIDKGSAQVWTCDLTQKYIEINADYRS